MDDKAPSSSTSIPSNDSQITRNGPPPSINEAAHARDYDRIPGFESKPLEGRGVPFSNMTNGRKR